MDTTDVVVPPTQAEQPPAAYRVRGDLGDAGRNARVTWSMPEEGDEAYIKSKFQDFLATFGLDDGLDFTEEPVPKYMAKIRALAEAGQSVALTVDMADLGTYDGKLLDYARVFPADSLVFMDEVATDILRQYEEQSSSVRVSLFNHPFVQPLRFLDPNHLDTLVAVTGVVIRTSAVLPDMQVATFVCHNSVLQNQEQRRCGFTVTVRLVNGEIEQPSRCQGCQKNHSFQLEHDLCLFGSKQLVKIQEPPDAIPEGEAPRSVMVYFFDDLIDAAKPGDHVEVTGILRASCMRANSRQRSVKSVYRTFVDANHVAFKATSSKHVSHADLVPEIPDDACFPLPPPEHPFERSLLAEFTTLANRSDVYDVLTSSFAPNIWEHDDVKKGLLCQLFGGTAKRIGSRNARGEIHVLLCGDPSTAKSQLLTYAHKLSPRGVYTCGRGTSAAGLTASVTRDPDTRDFVLESGAVVLSDRGVCCIDEFDKLDESSRVILHEVMEQQSVSIAKAGLVCSLNARAAILSSANPIGSRYDTKRSVVENINLPPTLLSRFDLIYLILDTYDAEKDRRLASHLCRLFTDDTRNEPAKAPLSKDFLVRYVAYAKAFVHPRLSDDAEKALVTNYKALRQQGTDSVGRSLTATPRQLESMIRLAEAQARMRLRSTVTAADVDEALRLMKASTYSSIVDPVTGRIDFDQLHTGLSDSAKARREFLEKAIRAVLGDKPTGLARDPLLAAINAFLELHSRPCLDDGRVGGRSEVDPVIRELEATGSIARTSGGSLVLQF